MFILGVNSSIKWCCPTSIVALYDGSQHEVALHQARLPPVAQGGAIIHPKHAGLPTLNSAPAASQSPKPPPNVLLCASWGAFSGSAGWLTPDLGTSINPAGSQVPKSPVPSTHVSTRPLQENATKNKIQK